MRYELKRTRKRISQILGRCVFLVVMVSLSPLPAAFAYEDADLAQQSLNPVANLISLPLQNNWDFEIGPADAMRYTLNVQPVIPFSLNDRYNLITRTIIPYIYAESPLRTGDDESGLGDILQSFFLSPKAPINGWIVGAGPVFLYPSATEDVLVKEKWCAGPTACLRPTSQGRGSTGLQEHTQ